MSAAGTLELLMGAYDWQEAMKYAQFKFDDIAEVLEAVEGENDGVHWRLLVRLKDGHFGVLNAYCDYTGWGCQEGGESRIVADEHEARTLQAQAYSWDWRERPPEAK